MPGGAALPTAGSPPSASPPPSAGAPDVLSTGGASVPPKTPHAIRASEHSGTSLRIRPPPGRETVGAKHSARLPQSPRRKELSAARGGESDVGGGIGATVG